MCSPPPPRMPQVCHLQPVILHWMLPRGCLPSFISKTIPPLLPCPFTQLYFLPRTQNIVNTYSVSAWIHPLQCNLHKGRDYDLFTVGFPVSQKYLVKMLSICWVCKI
jgi:hypothetical protein